MSMLNSIALTFPLNFRHLHEERFKLHSNSNAKKKKSNSGYTDIRGHVFTETLCIYVQSFANNLECLLYAQSQSATQPTCLPPDPGLIREEFREEFKRNYSGTTAMIITAPTPKNGIMPAQIRVTSDHFQKMCSDNTANQRWSIFALMDPTVFEPPIVMTAQGEIIHFLTGAHCVCGKVEETEALSINC
ncbi:hypothetical protein L218DRAFT_950473 [Marasmius fiardii PR-910]|nr:hypothetical protein L218DRAFT_950473 [Marasmius fiardii PR-910]